MRPLMEALERLAAGYRGANPKPSRGAADGAVGDAGWHVAPSQPAPSTLSVVDVSWQAGFGLPRGLIGNFEAALVAHARACIKPIWPCYFTICLPLVAIATFVDSSSNQGEAEQSDTQSGNHAF